MFAGFNGLESGVGAISCFVLGAANFFYGNQEACLIAFPLSAAFLAFLRYNWLPAKIFPGDTGTLLSGAAIAALSIWGRVEFVGICLIAPSAIDFTLKMISKHPFSHRRRFGDTTTTDDNVLTPPRYPALAHAFLRLARLKEHELVSSLLLMQTLYAALGIILMGLKG
jgi:UDP-N-acetylglucosamine--dolichyl-phosphate N-acetylglucosaminephosphotransferase